MRYTNKLHAPFDRLLSYDMNPHVALRKAIILQAVIDATSAAVDRKAIKARDEARRWVLESDEYFKRICFEGDINSKEIIAITQEMITESTRPPYKPASAIELCTNFKNNGKRAKISHKAKFMLAERSNFKHSA